MPFPSTPPTTAGREQEVSGKRGEGEGGRGVGRGKRSFRWKQPPTLLCPPPLTAAAAAATAWPRQPAESGKWEGGREPAVQGGAAGGGGVHGAALGVTGMGGPWGQLWGWGETRQVGGCMGP